MILTHMRPLSDEQCPNANLMAVLVNKTYTLYECPTCHRQVGAWADGQPRNGAIK